MSDHFYPLKKFSVYKSLMIKHLEFALFLIPLPKKNTLAKTRQSISMISYQPI